MTESAMPETVKAPSDGSFDAWAPDNVAPLVVWLGSSASAHITGKVFESQGGRISLCDGWRTDATVDKQARWLPGELGPVIDQLIERGVPAQRVWGA